MSQTETSTGTLDKVAVRSTRRALPRSVQLVTLLAVFVAGGVFGATVVTLSINSKMEAYRKNSPVFAVDIVSRLRIRLGLTDHQVDKVNEILVRRHERLIQYRDQGSQAMHVEFDALIQEVAGVLEGPQLERWQAVAESVRQRFLPPSGLDKHNYGMVELDAEIEARSFGRKPTEAIFNVFDYDGDLRLSEKEIPQRMWRRLSTLDSDDDGEVSLNEFRKFE